MLNVVWMSVIRKKGVIFNWGNTFLLDYNLSQLRWSCVTNSRSASWWWNIRSESIITKPLTFSGQFDRNTVVTMIVNKSTQIFLTTDIVVAMVSWGDTGRVRVWTMMVTIMISVIMEELIMSLVTDTVFTGTTMTWSQVWKLLIFLLGRRRGHQMDQGIHTTWMSKNYHRFLKKIIIEKIKLDLNLNWPIF